MLATRGKGGHRVGTNETRGDARARRRRGWDAMAAAWTTCRPRAVGWSGRGDHTLRAPDETVRKGDRRDTCQGHDGRCAAQQRSVPCRWWTAKSRALVRHPLGLAGGRQAPRMGLAPCTTGRNLARPLRKGAQCSSSCLKRRCSEIPGKCLCHMFRDPRQMSRHDICVFDIC